MARKRMVDPDFWVDEGVGECSRDARLLFIATWNFADDRGRLVANPKRLKAEVFPHDPDVSPELVDSWLQELEQAGLVLRYTSDGRDLLWIKSFLKHQNICRPSPSRLPPHPMDSEFNEESLSTPAHARAEVSRSRRSRSQEKLEEEKSEEVSPPARAHEGDQDSDGDGDPLALALSGAFGEMGVDLNADDLGAMVTLSRDHPWVMDLDHDQLRSMAHRCASNHKLKRYKAPPLSWSNWLVQAEKLGEDKRPGGNGKTPPDPPPKRRYFTASDLGQETNAETLADSRRMIESIKAKLPKPGEKETG